MQKKSSLLIVLFMTFTMIYLASFLHAEQTDYKIKNEKSIFNKCGKTKTAFKSLQNEASLFKNTYKRYDIKNYTESISVMNSVLNIHYIFKNNLFVLLYVESSPRHTGQVYADYFALKYVLTKKYGFPTIAKDGKLINDTKWSLIGDKNIREYNPSLKWKNLKKGKIEMYQRILNKTNSIIVVWFTCNGAKKTKEKFDEIEENKWRLLR